MFVETVGLQAGHIPSTVPADDHAGEQLELSGIVCHTLAANSFWLFACVGGDQYDENATLILSVGALARMFYTLLLLHHFATFLFLRCLPPLQNESL